MFSIDRLPSVQAGSPWSSLLCVTNSPAGQRSSGELGVTQSVCSMARQRARTGEEGSNIDGMAAPGTSL
ncbi:Uncharacterised protein [Mycobacteroides abscessus subsp. abscessus]|nr:Uncharacterised protein [Mycobacteroides abscessus subsp. abscessus]